MLAAKRIGYPYQPILLHAEVHALLMGFALAASMNYNHAYFFKLFLLIMIELITHFVIDVLKGKINVWYPAAANPANKIHWLIFGFDQLLHQLVIISIAAIAVIW